MVIRGFKKRILSICIVSFLLVAAFLMALPQAQAVKPPPAPITLTSPNPLAYVSGSGVAGGRFGATVAYGGDYIFVHGEGNFYVYNAKAQVLVNTIAGSTIAIGGGYVAIGNSDYASTSNKVVVYQLNNLRKVVATINAPQSHVGFGLSMAITDGKMLISDVGISSGDQPFSGDVYVYSLPSFNYITTLEQANPERAYGAPFGYSVAFFGSHIVVGAPDQTVNGATFAGNVYFYNSETYVLEKTIPDPQATVNGVSWGLFGQTIAVAGNNIWIGEPGATSTESGLFTGKVYCYNANGEQVTTLKTQKPNYGGFFGCSIAANDQYVLVGARGENVDTDSDTILYAGRVYVFSPSGTYLRTLTSPNPQIFGLFGSSVALGQGYIVVGAPEENATVRYRSTTQTYWEAGSTHILS